MRHRRNEQRHEARRCQLIDKKYDEGLTPEEARELDALQKESAYWLNKEHPLPDTDCPRCGGVICVCGLEG